MKSSMGRIVISFIILMLLNIVPFPLVFRQLQFPWVLLFILYIQFFLPQYFNITLVFILGLLVDGMLHTIFGQHAFGFLMVCWLAQTRARRFVFFNITQQMLIIGSCIGIHHLTLQMTNFIFGYQTFLLPLIVVPLIAMLIWPWFKLAGDTWLFVRKNPYNFR